MPSIGVTLPSMLATLIGGDRRFELDATSIADAVDSLFTRHPELRVHLLDEQGALRPHVMLFHNDHALRALEGTIRDGDTLTVLQAVSGG